METIDDEIVLPSVLDTVCSERRMSLMPYVPDAACPGMPYEWNESANGMNRLE